MENITCNDFIKVYLNTYKLIEEEFCNTFKYVEPEKDNYETYSNEYLKLILLIGSEILNMLKFTINLYDPDNKDDGFNITTKILKYEPDFINTMVLFDKYEILLPWKDGEGGVPNWWHIYNNIKHKRFELTKGKINYKYANFKNVLYSLSALYTLEMYAFRKIAIDTEQQYIIPFCKSIFSIVNSYWEKYNSNELFIYDENSGNFTISTEL